MSSEDDTPDTPDTPDAPVRIQRSFRLDANLLADLDAIAEELKISRTAALHLLLVRAIPALRRDLADSPASP